MYHFTFQRKQKEVQKENEFYFQLLQQAIPADQVQNLESNKGTTTATTNDITITTTTSATVTSAVTTTTTKMK